MASIQRGKFSHRPRNLPKFFGGKYPFIQVTDIAASVGDLVPATQFLSEDGVAFSRSFPPNTVLISITGAVIGKTAIARQEIWTPDSIIGIQANRNVHPEFIELVLRRLHPLLNGSLATKSTTQKNINLETLRPLLVPCPGLDEQRNIASVLYKIQSRTALHASRAQLAQSVAQAVLTQTDQFGGNGHV
jgi:type I restriction enzyme S subunit